MKKHIVLFAWLAVALVAVPIRFAAAAGYKMPITFGGYTNKSEVLTNFPVLVVLSNNVGGSTLDMSTFVNTNGWDLRFVANLEDTASLNYEIESWNTNGPCYVWVQVPTIPGDGSGSIWAKWGGESTQLPCTTNGATWTNGYAGVWHFASSSGTSAWDSSPRTNRAALVNMAGNEWGGGKIGNALEWKQPDDATLTERAISEDKYTFSFWVKTTAISVNSRLIVPTDTHWILFQGSSQKLGFWSTYWCANANVSGSWEHYAFVYDRANSVLDCYRNGALGGHHTGVSKSKPSGRWYFGQYESGSSDEPWTGWLDEVQISSTLRSSNWVWACHQNTASNTAFNSYGPAESLTSPGAPDIVANAATDITTTNAILNGTLNTNGSSAAEVYVVWGPEQKGATLEGWAYTNYFGTNTLDTPRDYATNTSFTAALTPGTPYFYRYYAVNAVTGTWSGPISFTAWQTPAVNNDLGAATITTVSALLRGTVTAGVPTPNVFFCLNEGSDPNSTDTSQWDRVISAGTASADFSATASGLTLNTLYYYRAYATNAVSADFAWAPAAGNFTTLALCPFNLASNHTINAGESLVGTNPAVTLPATSLGGGTWRYDFGPYGYTNLNLGGFKLQTDNGGSGSAKGTPIKLDLNGGDIYGSVTNTPLDTRSSNLGLAAGDITISNVRDITMGKIEARLGPIWPNGYAGDVQVAASGLRARNVTIAGIDASTTGGKGGNVTIYASGDVLIQNAVGSVTTRNDIVTWGNAWAGLGSGNVLIDSAGFNVNDIDVREPGSGNYGASGAVTLTGGSGGSCVIRDIIAQVVYNASGGGGAADNQPVAIRGYAGVSVRNIGIYNECSYYAGNLTITNISGNIDITGAINLNSAKGDNYDGILRLQAGGSITVTNLDLSKLRYAAFDGNGTSYITGLLTGTNGLPASGLSNISTNLRTPSGERIIYITGQNPALNGQTITLADLAGAAGAGGKLLPLQPKGTVLLIQ